MKNFFSLAPTAVALTLIFIGSGCSDSSSSQAGAQFDTEDETINQSNDFDEVALIANLTNNIVQPSFENFELQSTALIEATDAYCQSELGLASGDNDASVRDSAKSLAQTEWRQTMNVWQTIEMMQIGPLVSNQSSLKNKIYSWPVISSCAVDQDVVYFNQGEINGVTYDINNRVVTRRGLDALEYLLFNQDLNHSCSATSAPQNWDSYTDAQRLAYRCQYAVEVSKDIQNNAQILLAEWNGEQGYANSLLNAQTAAGPDFANSHEAINRFSDALFYLGKVTKDAKLGTPLGLFPNRCQQNICPEDLESQYALHSLENIKANLQGFQRLFSGQWNTQEEAVGFDDYLVNVGAESVATNIHSAIDTALTNLDAYQVTLDEALINTPNNVQLTHDQIKAITDQVKTDFINELALQLPASSAGDND